MPQPDTGQGAPAPAYDSFRRVVEAAKLAPGQPVEADLSMDADDRARLAEEFGIPAIRVLKGTALAARRGGLIEVEGRVTAELTRQCVASLDEMTEAIDEDFLVTFSEHAETSQEPEVEADLDAPEPIEGGRIDLGAVLIEQLVLGMHPHPRKPDAEAPEDPGAGARITPFDVLETLRGSASND